ncbi:MAG: type II secretion system F family protein [Candidatus Omnitrophota bacterium]
MAEYTYVAKDNAGRLCKGSATGKNQYHVRQQLEDVGLYAVSVDRAKESFSLGLKVIRPTDLVIFARQFSTMLDAGFSIVTALKTLEKQTLNRKLKAVICDIRLNVEAGDTLSVSLAKHPEAFSEFFIALVKAGEAAGMLVELFERLSNHLEKQDNLRRSIKGAFAYPTIIGVFAFLVMFFLVAVIVPIFKDIYIRMRLNLPLPTQLLIAISDFVRFSWSKILFLAAGAIAVIRSLNKRAEFRNWVDGVKMRLFIFGPLVKSSTAARFVRTLGDMVTSGVGLQEGLLVADKVAGSNVISKITKKMIDNMQRGGRISEALTGEQIFPAMIEQMLASGEESGKLDYMLEKSANILEREVAETVKSLIVKIEPVMTFFMAILVGFIAVAIYLPMFDVIQQMGH